MKKALKIILLIWPVALLLSLEGYHYYMRRQVDKGMEEANGLVWKNAEIQLTVQIKEREQGEQIRYLIQVTNSDKKAVFNTSATIDRDMFGGGFVKAMQVDKDPEKEVVFWGAHEDKFFLDFSEKTVKKKPFVQALQEAQALGKQWHQYYVLANFEWFLLMLLALFYYTLFGMIVGIIWVFRRKNRTSTEGTIRGK